MKMINKLIILTAVSFLISISVSAQSVKNSINERIDETIQRFPEDVRNDIQLVFSAHGTPVSLVKKGDPYNEHIKQTVEMVMTDRNNSHLYHLCYHKKFSVSDHKYHS